MPTIGRIEELKRLCASIKRQDLAEDKYELLVISENYLPLVDKLILEHDFLNFKYLQTGRRGVNYSRNMGLEHASGEFIYFLDDDCELIRSQQLNLIVDQLTNTPNIDGIGGAYILGPDAGIFEKAYHAVAETWFQQHFLHGVYTDRLFGGNAAYNLRAIGKLRFDERIRFGGAEEEFNAQLVRLGHKLLADEKLSVRHNVKVSFIQFFKKAALQGFWHGERSERLPSMPIAKTKFFEANKNSAVALRIAILIYRGIFRFAADLKGSKSVWRWVVQIVFITPARIFNEIFEPKLKIMRVYYGALRVYYNFMLPAYYKSLHFYHELKSFIKRQKANLTWRVLWPLSYPFRKIYYFFDYQIHIKQRNQFTNHD